MAQNQSTFQQRGKSDEKIILHNLLHGMSVQKMTSKLGVATVVERPIRSETNEMSNRTVKPQLTCNYPKDEKYRPKR